MFNSILGTVKTGKTKRRIEVKWDSHCKKVYVAFGGWTFIGKAYSVGMQ